MCPSIDRFQPLERKLVHFPNLGKNRPVFFQALEAGAADAAARALVLIGADEVFMAVKNLLSNQP